MKKDKIALIDKLTKKHLENIKSIEDIPESSQIDVIKSILDAPVIPISFARLKQALGDNVKIMKDGKELDFEKLRETEQNDEQGFTPNWFINLVLDNPKYINPMISQININSIMAHAHESFVTDPDNPIHDEFRATCQLRYDDIQKIRKLKELQKQQQDKENSKSKKNKEQR